MSYSVNVADNSKTILSGEKLQKRHYIIRLSQRIKIWWTQPMIATARKGVNR